MVWDWNTESFVEVYLSHEEVMMDIEIPRALGAMLYENVGFPFYPLERDCR